MPSKSVRNSVGAMTMRFLSVSSATIGELINTESATLIASDACADAPTAVKCGLGRIQSTRLPTRLNVTKSGS